jgi:H+/Cl- antiporter ClcA
VVLGPALGGLLYGPLVSRFAPEARGHGVPEVMLAVAEHEGRRSRACIHTWADRPADHDVIGLKDLL